MTLQVGELYLCMVKDLYDSMIVGWAMEVRALTLAKANRIDPAKTFVFHSDLGNPVHERQADAMAEH